MLLGVALACLAVNVAESELGYAKSALVAVYRRAPAVRQAEQSAVFSFHRALASSRPVRSLSSSWGRLSWIPRTHQRKALRSSLCCPCSCGHCSGHRSHEDSLKKVCYLAAADAVAAE